MTHARRMSVVFLTSVLWFGCAHDEPLQRTMHERADYEAALPEAATLNLQSSAAVAADGKFLARPEPRIAEVWVYPQRLSENEYFWGAWVSIRLEDEQWEAQSMTQREPSSPKKRPKNAWPKHRKAKS